ncbi:MAG: hypothetical protein OEX22_03450 [Cyclobacteriaceae bacterium]|nr:hypothetical protein [Cyclobacteriaceae bacterium]
MKKIFIAISVFFLLHQNSGAQNIPEAYKTKFTKYRISSKNCTMITHFTGSQLFIPEKAFLLNDSDNIDSLNLYYKEIRTPLEILVNEIPMTAKISGRDYFLESNGMFEVWAKSGDDTIAVHEDKSIVVRLATKPNEVDVRMEGFRFNYDQHYWESFTNRLKFSSINKEDDDLWGSSPIENDVYIEVEGREWAKKDSIREVAFQEMEIFDFGFYNYDRILVRETFVSIKADFTNEKNKKFNDTVYVVYEGIKSVFYYPPSVWEDGFSVIKNRPYKLFLIDEEGVVYTLKTFPDLEGITTHAFVLSNDGIAKDRIELANKIGI